MKDSQFAFSGFFQRGNFLVRKAFSNIKNRLQDSAMKLVHAERLGEAFDSQLVIGVRESYGMF